MIDKKLKFSIEKFDITNENPNSQFATAKIQAFASNLNKHDLFCSEEVLQRTAPSIYNKPILYNIAEIFQDFGSHISADKTLIAGFCVPDTATFERLSDSRLALNVDAKIWKRYSPKFMKIIEQEKNKSVSVEMDLLDSEERPDGTVEMKDFEYSGVCVLGDIVTPAVKDSNIQMVSFAEEQKLYNDAIQKEFGFKYDDIDFTIPEEVKKNVELGLSLYKQHNKGGNSVSLASARFLAKSERANHEKVRHISKSLKAKKFNNMVKDPPSEEYISWLLYGGIEGKDWSEKIEKELDESDSKHLSYFGEVVTFPYKEVKDMNPALKGINPPISVEQGNLIAKQADAIGADKNGWPIAISAFKKSYEVKDGKWVKKSEKEEMSVDEIEEKKEEMAVDTAKDEKEETPKEEKQETPEEEKKEQEEKTEEKMSLNAWLDVKAVLSMLADETESYGKVAEEFAKEPEQMNYGLVMGAMYSKMCKMTEMCGKFAEVEEKNKAYMAENEELKKFKADVEDRQFKYEVDTCMSEIKNSVEIPQEDFDNLVEESKKFSLETIDAFKNLARSKAFSFAVKGKKSKDDPVKYGFPWGNGSKPEKKSIWS